MKTGIEVAKTGAIYGSRLIFPFFFAFVASEEIWDREMKRLKVTDTPYPTSTGHCMTLMGNQETPCCLVTLHERSDDADPGFIAGILAHEAVHVWQAMVKSMGERKPGVEFEAYMIQHITVELMAAYGLSRKPIFGKPDKALLKEFQRATKKISRKRPADRAL